MKKDKLLLSKWGDTEVWLKDGTVYMVSIDSDSDTESPRTWDNFGTLLLWGKSSHCSDIDPTLNDGRKVSDFWTDPQDFLQYHPAKSWLILPVYKYEHGSVAYNTTGFSCSWDSGQVGYIFASKEAAIKEFGVNNCTKSVREKALACMASEVATFGAWANGQCYSYTVESGSLEDILGDYISLDAFNALSDKEKKEFWHEWIDTEDYSSMAMHDSCGGFIETDCSIHDMYCYSEAMSSF